MEFIDFNPGLSLCKHGELPPGDSSEVVPDTVAARISALDTSRHTQTHTDTHIHTQTHTDTHRHTDIHRHTQIFNPDPQDHPDDDEQTVTNPGTFYLLSLRGLLSRLCPTPSFFIITALQ